MSTDCVFELSKLAIRCNFGDSVPLHVLQNDFAVGLVKLTKYPVCVGLVYMLPHQEGFAPNFSALYICVLQTVAHVGAQMRCLTFENIFGVEGQKQVQKDRSALLLN